MTFHRFAELLAIAVVAVAMLFAAGPASAGPPDFGLSEEESSADAVRARLVSTHVAAQPGEEILVGVHLSQAEGWHTYWRNGGDSGLPTQVDWKLPEGFVVGELRWPVPHRYVEAGDLVTFGYQGDVVLLATLAVPADASPAEVVLGADVEWLMCKELCIPGSAELQMRLEIGQSRANDVSSDLALIEEARARWPRPASHYEDLDLRTALDLTRVPAGQAAIAAISVGGLEEPTQAEWTWFPWLADPVFPDSVSSVVHEGALILGLPFQLEEEAPAGTTLQWGGVLQLRTRGGEHLVRVELPIPVAGPDDRIESANEALFETLLGLRSAAGSGGLFDQSFAESAGGTSRSLIYYLLLALVGGVILNVMPCVLPVLSLKVMSFVRHAGEDRSVQIRLGLTFMLGVLVSFLTLAVVVIGLQAAGDQLGWGFQFQNPAFVVAMAVVVFAFGLSLFGVYEVVLPLSLGGGGSRGGAYAESFLNGILATALATPCTAPFLGTALGFAFTQPAASILAIFLTIGLGLSLPYVLLSLNPAWLRFVPKPGAWMDRFKQGMGFLLMATLIWLLWVLGQQIGVGGVVWTMAFLLVVGFALWMYGAFAGLTASASRRAFVIGLMAVMITVAGWRFLSEPLSAEALAAHRSTVPAEEGRWRPFSVQTLEAEVAAGNTVFVDFTAAWCTTCKVNEKTVLATSEVESKFEELGVVTLLGDWTYRDEEITRVLRKFGRSGVPFYAVFPAERLDSPIILPELITQGIVLDALNDAGPSRSVVGR